jgi:Trpc4-associated protein
MPELLSLFELKISLLTITKFVLNFDLRFWLIRAIESFLRGNTSYADQLFLIKRGIVEDTVQNILAINFTRPKEVLQSCFDMLGELVKFNTDGFDILNKELVDNEKVFIKFKPRVIFRF